MTQEERWISCPMCGFEFHRGDTACEHGCPLGAFCNLVSCPNCDYEFPYQKRRTSQLWSFLRREKEESALPETVRAASQLKPGEQAEVVCLGSSKTSRYSALTLYGLEPGALITLVQQLPSCVLRIDETELALDREIADEILVRTP